MDFRVLETEGGKMAVTLFMLVFLSIIALVMHMTHHDPLEPGRAAMLTAFGSLMGVLIAKLGGKQQP